MKKFILLGIIYLFASVTNGQICNNWLSTQTQGAYATIGDLDVTGNTITVEAIFNRTGPLNNGLYYGHLISKHTGTTDANYTLLPNGCEITTATGYYSTFQTCPPLQNTTYHVAMVYDGATLRFYRNGVLLSSQPCTGNLVTNNLPTTISQWAFTPQINNQFLGVVNEVRIWNVARTQTQLILNMVGPILNPTTQNGLLGYYTFNSPNNLASTTNSFNATLFGGAALNANNPNCLLSVGSCCTANTTSQITKCRNVNTNLNARAGTTYSWSPSTGLNATNIQNPICTATTNTTYTVTVFNAASNCTNIDVVNVTVNPSVVSNIKDTTICNKDSVRLIAPIGNSYSWSPATYINNTTVSNPLVWPPITTNYIVTITNSFGCITRDTVLVTVNDCGCEDSCNWSKTGNTFVKATNFIGSKNYADFKVRTNNTQRMVVTANGNIGLNTPTPTKTLDVNGEAVVRNLPTAAPNDKLVLANANGELKSLSPGSVGQYLSGDGTWQNLPPAGSGTITAADQGVTLDGTTIQLGDYCGKGGSAFSSNREININNQNLYFNSSEIGKIYMGNSSTKPEYCKELNARLEISSLGLKAANEYLSPYPSTSGLRFTNLTALDKPIENKYNAVLSLDEDGDVIWVNACCNNGTNADTKSILDRLDKLEAELKSLKKENTDLKIKLNQINVTLETKNNVLEQNVPNPFTESTVIGYNIVSDFSKAVMIFSTINGETIKTVQLNNKGKGQINVAASFIAKGVYTYSLVVDGKVIETKKMIKE
jgi:Concanavalin A-like lectin/glucanases superfamily